jgi:hypothetical protein
MASIVSRDSPLEQRRRVIGVTRPGGYPRVVPDLSGKGANIVETNVVVAIFIVSGCIA